MAFEDRLVEGYNTTIILRNKMPICPTIWQVIKSNLLYTFGHHTHQGNEGHIPADQRETHLDETYRPAVQEGGGISAIWKVCFYRLG